MKSLTAQGSSYYSPDIQELKRLSAANESNIAKSLALLERAGGSYSLNQLATLINTVLSPDNAALLAALFEASSKVRQRLFGNWIVPMAPIEVSNTCASDCLFCGWRVSNRSMKRLKMPVDLVMLQVDYLIDKGINYIEFVSGDDITVVRDLMPQLIRETRRKFDERGITGKISFCTLALTEEQYSHLKSCGADNMIVWQEAYDADVFHTHIKGGPKAFGITDDWKVDRSGEGCRFRIQSQERALRAGLEVGLGSMLGLNPDVTTEFLATVDHARYLADNYTFSPAHPMIIGMPIWNNITTRDTDLRPAEALDMNTLFPALAALYLLALPDDSTWVFPNCRVSLQTQIHTAKIAGAFSSTEVKLGPGGYLPTIIAEKKSRGEDTTQLENQVFALLKESGNDIQAMRKLLDEREQFLHHYHAHQKYVDAVEGVGLQFTPDTIIPAGCSA